MLLIHNRLDMDVKPVLRAGLCRYAPAMPPPKTPTPDAETIALRALTYIAGDDDRLQRFLGLTGIEPGSLRGLARDPGGLGAVLDYVLGWEPLLLEFAEAEDLPPESIAAARRKLPGSSEDG